MLSAVATITSWALPCSTRTSFLPTAVRLQSASLLLDAFPSLM